MRALSMSERRKRGCGVCAFHRKKKIGKALKDGDTGVVEALGINIKHLEVVMLCPFAKCKFTELDELNDYDKEYHIERKD